MSLETLNRGKRVSSSSREEQLQPLMFFFHRARVSPSRLVGPVFPSRGASFGDLFYHRRRKASSIEVLVAHSETKKREPSLAALPLPCRHGFFFLARAIRPFASGDQRHRPPRDPIEANPRRTFVALAWVAGAEESPKSGNRSEKGTREAREKRLLCLVSPLL